MFSPTTYSVILLQAHVRKHSRCFRGKLIGGLRPLASTLRSPREAPQTGSWKLCLRPLTGVRFLPCCLLLVWFYLTCNTALVVA